MSADLPPDRIAIKWLAKLPGSKEDGLASGFDGRAWLAGYLEAAARSKAEEVFLGVSDFLAAAPRTADEFNEYLSAPGLALLDAWCSTAGTFGIDSEPWAEDVATQVVRAYKARVEELMDTSGAEGRA